MTRTVLSNFVLGSANRFQIDEDADELDDDELIPAYHVEECDCPIGYIGQHCEQCGYGYRREPINGGVFSRCIPCTCNNHSVTCDPNTGKCDCLHHTSGDNCEKCESGYYGNALFPSDQVNIKLAQNATIKSDKLNLIEGVYWP